MYQSVIGSCTVGRQYCTVPSMCWFCFLVVFCQFLCLPAVVSSAIIVLLLSWASAHRVKWGQLTPLEKWMKNYKAKTCKKSQFSEWGWGWSDTSDDWLVRWQGALTPLTKILRTPLAIVTIVVMTVTAVSDRDTCLQNWKNHWCVTVFDSL